LNRQLEEITGLLDANFDRRRKIYRLSEDNILMVETARSTGASAKFTGSGGAIVGTYENEQMFKQLRKKLGSLNIKVLKPKITSNKGKVGL
jgi:glucuronokinase